MRTSVLKGISVHGSGRGRELGFPTANIALDDSVKRPADGIYAAWVRVSPPVSGRESHMAAVHVGPVPTFNVSTSTIEVHLLDFGDQDLYGSTFSVELVKKIRDVETFLSTDDLKDAIAADCRAVRHYFAS